jgi:zinc D-Ala-D-Ala dipeptidase
MLAFIFPLLFWLFGYGQNHSTNNQSSAAATLKYTPQYFDSLGLVNIQEVDEAILVDLKYASEDNFLKTNLYGNLKDCYAPELVALKLHLAQEFLVKLRPKHKLLIFDLTRPLAVQKRMWDLCKLPDSKKINYIAHPSVNSLHNYGAAVDITIVDENDHPIDMGSAYDEFANASNTSNELDHFEDGTLSEENFRNRRLLRKVMAHAGFEPISSEWWHFNYCSISEAKKAFKLIQ